MDYRENFTTLFRKNYAALCWTAKKILQNENDARDIVGEVFIKLWKAKSEITDLNKLTSLLFTSITNASIDRLRLMKHRSAYQEKMLCLLKDDDQSYILKLQQEVLQEIYMEIKSLPPQCRNIFELLYVEGLEYKEVAEKLNLAEQTVRNQKTRGIALLKRKLFPDELFAVAVTVSTTAAIVTLGVLLFFCLKNFF